MPMVAMINHSMMLWLKLLCFGFGFRQMLSPTGLKMPRFFFSDLRVNPVRLLSLAPFLFRMFRPHPGGLNDGLGLPANQIESRLTHWHQLSVFPG